MRLLRFILAAGTAAGLLPRAAFAQAETPPDLEITSLNDDSLLENDFNSRTWHGRGGIIIKQGNTILVADEARLNETTLEVVADGMVTLQSEGFYWAGEHLEYNFTTREIGANTFRAGVAPAFIRAEAMTGSTTNKVYLATDALFTSDDVEHPNYSVRAKEMRVVQGKEVVARGAKLYLGNVPVFYLPYYRRSLRSHSNFFTFAPGFRSSFGPYLLTTYQINAYENFNVGLNLDYRVKRGVGLGPKLEYDFGKWGEGEFEYYFAHDEHAKHEPLLKPFSDERERLKFTYSAQVRTNLAVKADVNYQSDPRFLRDFFEFEYRTDPQPDTVFEVSKFWSNFSLDFLAQPQISRDFATVERLPDIKLSALRQQLGVSPFYYEGENSFAYLRNRPGILGGTNYAAFRGDTYHQIVLPQTYFGFLNITPRAGARGTHYEATESEELQLEEEDRFVFNTGVEANFKASRVFPGASSALLDVKELRHIIEPSVNYVFVPRPDERPRDLPQFDSEVPSLRLLPIEYPDYNSIDSIDARNVIRLSLRNKLQTKRDGEVDTLANWLLVTDWRLDPFDGQATFSDIYSDLDFKPRSWIVLNSETRYNLDHGQFNLSHHSITVTPGDRWSARVGHRYYRGDIDGFEQDFSNNLFYTTFYYRINENWGARMSHHFEARDGTMEEQYYTVYRDFRSFTAALTFRARDQREGPVDYTVGISFQLKAKPKRSDRDRLDPSFLLRN